MMKRAFLLLVALFFMGNLPIQAQDDPWIAVTSLLDQAEASLENGDLVVAQGLMNGAALLLSDEVIAACDGGLGARALLQQAATAADVPTAQALLSSARTLLATCNSVDPAAQSTAGPTPADSAPEALTPPFIPASAPAFDGATMVSIPHQDTFNVDTFTIEGWVYADAYTYGGILTKGTETIAYSVQIFDGFVYLTTNWADWQSNTWNSSLRIQTGVWQHFAVSYDGREVRFYINGEPDPAVGAVTEPIRHNREPLVIGADLPGNPEYFTGQIGELRLWNIVRTPEEIRDARNGVMPPQWQGTAQRALAPGLVAQFPYFAGGTSEGVYLADDGQVRFTSASDESNPEADLATSAGGQLVHLNSAGLEELMSLPGIGQVTAERILAYREQVGRINTLEELDAIEGIGPATLERLRPLVSLDVAMTPTPAATSTQAASATPQTILATPDQFNQDVALLVFPPPDSVVTGIIPISGSASHPQFAEYILEYGPNPNPGDLWFTFWSESQSVVNGDLGILDTTLMSDGAYLLRLRVTLADGGHLVSDPVNVLVLNQAGTPSVMSTPDDATLPATTTPTSTHGPSVMGVVMQGNLDEEVVLLKNETGNTISLAGWALADSDGHIYTFPDIRLFADGRVSIFTRSGTDTPTSLYWGLAEPIWEQGDVVTLIDASGAVYATTTHGGTEVVPCPVHRVQAGDTLALIGTQYGVSLTALLEANNLSDGDAQFLTVDDALVVPQGNCSAFVWGDPVLLLANFGVEGCAWQGVAGQVADQDGASISTPLQVRVYNDMLDATAVTGSNSVFGVSGWSVSIGDQPVEQQVYVQLLTSDGIPLSVSVPVSFPGTCEANLAAVSFYQWVNTRPMTPTGTLAGRFSADVWNGTAPLRVQFTDESTGTIDRYAWDFGDGTTSSEPNPVHTFTEPGIYTVSLTVSGPRGSESVVMRTIVVDPDPAVTEGRVVTVPPPTATWTPTDTPTPTNTPTWTPSTQIPTTPAPVGGLTTTQFSFRSLQGEAYFVGSIEHPAGGLAVSDIYTLIIFSTPELQSRLADENPFRSDRDFVMVLDGDVWPGYAGMSIVEVGAELEQSVIIGIYEGTVLEPSTELVLGDKTFARSRARVAGVPVTLYYLRVGDEEVLTVTVRGANLSIVEPTIEAILASLEVRVDVVDRGTPTPTWTPSPTRTPEPTWEIFQTPVGGN